MSHRIILTIFLIFYSCNSYSSDLNIYNWSDYIEPATLKNFSKKYKIKVNYDVFDSDYMLESKTILNGVSYDIVVPSAFPFLMRHVEMDFYKKIDHNKIKNYNNLDPNILNLMKKSGLDQYAIPWMWGTVGIGYNKNILKDYNIQDLDDIFNPEKLEKISKLCKIEFIDIHNEVIPAALLYLELDPNSTSDADLLKVRNLFKSIRKYIYSFHPSRYIEDLASGDVCLVFGFSGDIMNAKRRAEESGLRVDIDYVIPKSGAQIWIDAIAIPKNAKNIDNAYAFIDYLLDPEISAQNTNYINFANANSSSRKFVDHAISTDQRIYPDIGAGKYYTINPISKDIENKRNKVWIEFVGNLY